LFPLGPVGKKRRHLIHDVDAEAKESLDQEEEECDESDLDDDDESIDEGVIEIYKDFYSKAGEPICGNFCLAKSSKCQLLIGGRRRMTDAFSHLLVIITSTA